MLIWLEHIQNHLSVLTIHKLVRSVVEKESYLIQANMIIFGFRPLYNLAYASDDREESLMYVKLRVTSNNCLEYSTCKDLFISSMV